MELLFSGWARQVTFLVLYVTVVEMLLPAGELRRYVKLVLGLVVLLALIDPLLHLVRGRDVEDLLLLPVEYLESPRQTPVEAGLELSQTMTRETAAVVKTSAEAEIEQQLVGLSGVASARVDLSSVRPQVELTTDRYSDSLAAQVRHQVALATGVDSALVDLQLDQVGGR